MFIRLSGNCKTSAGLVLVLGVISVAGISCKSRALNTDNGSVAQEDATAVSPEASHEDKIAEIKQKSGIFELRVPEEAAVLLEHSKRNHQSFYVIVSNLKTCAPCKKLDKLLIDNPPTNNDQASKALIAVVDFGRISDDQTYSNFYHNVPIYLGVESKPERTPWIAFCKSGENCKVLNINTQNFKAEHAKAIWSGIELQK